MMLEFPEMKPHPGDDWRDWEIQFIREMAFIGASTRDTCEVMHWRSRGSIQRVAAASLIRFSCTKARWSEKLSHGTSAAIRPVRSKKRVYISCLGKLRRAAYHSHETGYVANA